MRVSTAVDALTETVRTARPDTAMSFLATPTDVFAVPGEAVDASAQAYADRRTSKLLRGPLRTLSGGRLLRRNYVPGEDPGINDSRRAPAGPQLPARQAAPALAGDVGPGPGRHGVVQDRARPRAPARS